MPVDIKPRQTPATERGSRRRITLNALENEKINALYSRTLRSQQNYPRFSPIEKEIVEPTDESTIGLSNETPATTPATFTSSNLVPISAEYLTSASDRDKTHIHNPNLILVSGKSPSSNSSLGTPNKIVIKPKVNGLRKNKSMKYEEPNSYNIKLDTSITLKSHDSTFKPQVYDTHLVLPDSFPPTVPQCPSDRCGEALEERLYRLQVHGRALSSDKKTFHRRKGADSCVAAAELMFKNKDFLNSIHITRDTQTLAPSSVPYSFSILPSFEDPRPLAYPFMDHLTRPRTAGYSPGHIRSMHSLPEREFLVNYKDSHKKNRNINSASSSLFSSVSLRRNQPSLSKEPLQLKERETETTREKITNFNDLQTTKKVKILQSTSEPNKQRLAPMYNPNEDNAEKYGIINKANESYSHNIPIIVNTSNTESHLIANFLPSDYQGNGREHYISSAASSRSVVSSSSKGKQVPSNLETRFNTTFLGKAYINTFQKTQQDNKVGKKFEIKLNQYRQRQRKMMKEISKHIQDHEERVNSHNNSKILAKKSKGK